MTEADYLGGVEYRPLLVPHRHCSRSRRWRHFALACCRLLWPTLTEQARGVVELAERFLDRQATEQELLSGRERLLPEQTVPAIDAVFHAAERTARIKSVARHDVPVRCLAAYSMMSGKRVRAEVNAKIAHLVREVFGNPYRTVVFEPAWQTAEVQSLARAAYEERLEAGYLDPARLNILADALLDVGCDQQDALTHLREPGPHVRGCWVLEHLLGKE